MSYRAYQIARLHGRDLVYLVRYLAQSLRNDARTKRLVLCNSYPKSGTHLLYQILYTIPGLRQRKSIVSVQALCGIMNTASHIRWKIGAAPPDSIIRCHLTYSEEILDILNKYDCTSLFIYRDLRDVAVSHARWVCNEPRIFLHDIYRNELTRDDDRLMATIRGIPLGSPLGSNVSQPDIGQDFARWLGWIYDPETLAVRFEDLVGERGGGSEEARLETVRQILDYLEVSVPAAQIRSRFASLVMDPEESHTFRKGGTGTSGGWREAFTEEHKQTFKQVAGELLVELGYERDMKW
jgi:hypothetical protein